MDIILKWDEAEHPRAEDGKFGSGGGGAAPSADAPKSEPKWGKSKHAHNEYGYSITHGDKRYEVYFDRQSGSWNALELLNVSGPGGSPVDWIGHNRADVTERIKSGKYDAAVERYGEKVSVVKEWNEADHPREPAGSGDGGQFSGGGGAAGAKDWDNDKTWGEIGPDQRGKGKQFFVGDWINSHDPKIPTQEAKDRALGEWEDLPEHERLAWAKGAHEAQARIDERNAPRKTGWAAVPEDQKAMVRENWAKDWAERQQAGGAKQNTAHLLDMGREHFDNRGDEAKLNHFNRMDADEFVKPGAEAAHPVEDIKDWNDVPREHQVAAREDFGRAWAEDNKDAAALQNVETEQREQMGRVAFDRKNELKKLDWAKAMDAQKFPAPEMVGDMRVVGPGAWKPGEGPGDKMVGPDALGDYNEWQHVPPKWQAVAQNQFEREWPEWAQKHGPEEFKDATPERLQEIARSRWDGLEDNSKLEYAQNKVPRQDFPELARRDFNATDPHFWGDQPGGLQPLAPGLPTGQQGKEPRVGMPGGGTTPDANEEADRLQQFRQGRGSRPDEAVMQRWKDRGWIAEDATFEKNNDPEPEAWDDDDNPTPPAPENWDELAGDKQERVKDAWIEQNRSQYVRDEIENWQQDEYNFHDIPEELGKDAEWNKTTIKEMHDNYYPGEPVEGLNDSGGGSPAQHAEADRRIKEWNDKFNIEASLENGAFITDNVTGKLEVDTDKLVFSDNPHEGSEQQTLPGISQEELSNAFKKAQWAKVKDDYENMYKEAFDKEAAERVEHAKENPPDYLEEGAVENLGEIWSGMDSKEKFAQAAKFLNTNELQAGEESPNAEGVAGTIEPRKDDTKEQKAIQAKKVKSQRALNGGISTTKIVTMDDGSKYVWKPSTGEVGAGRLMPAGTQYAREVAANDLAHLVGMGDMVADTAIIKHEGVWGAALFAIPNSHNDGMTGNSRFQEDARKASFFDYVISNVDRHENNWMSDKDGKLWMIDHGRAFPNKERHLGHTGLSFGIDNDKSDPNGEPWEMQIPESIRKPWRGKYDQIVKIMERRGLGDAAISSLKIRYDKAMRENITWRELFGEGD